MTTGACRFTRKEARGQRSPSLPLRRQVTASDDDQSSAPVLTLDLLLGIETCPPMRARPRAGQSQPRSQGPVIAKVLPGIWMETNSHLPSGL